FAPSQETTHQSPVRKLMMILASLCLAITGLGDGSERARATEPLAELGSRDAIILGVVEGITEFLPISSTGHLIIANHFLGLESDTPLTDANGRPLWHKKPSARNPAGEPLTLKLAADTYAVVIQIGAILAVALLYWERIAAMLKGLSGRDPSGLRLLRNLIFAFVPVAVVGLAASSVIESHLFSIGTVIVGLVGGALLMLWIERWRRVQAEKRPAAIEPADLSPGAALKIGFIQCLALWPGTSRSMVTIVGGYLAGLSPAKAAEFSFLLGLPVLAGAAVVKGWRSGPAMIEVFGWSDILLGVAVAALSAAVAVKFLVSFLTKHGLQAFAVYRLVLAATIAVVFYL
ncbi:MAG: undecaprenyl-diphosphate phosphatase, partial [Cephaloticoccus sp.]|nr:undecaprenyl-diphosphate phosphatase [Cephaloticoccus sp.]